MEADLPAAIPAPPGETSAQKAIRHERNKAVRDATRIARDQANRDMAEQLADQSDELALLKSELSFAA